MTADAATRATTASPMRQGLVPLMVDVAVPVGTYYLLNKGFGLDEVTSLAVGSAVPAVRTVWGLVAQRRFNALAILMLAVNVAGLLLGLISGDPRLMLAKESVVTSVVGIAFLVSVLLGRPLMSSVLRPTFGRGQAVRLAAWDRLSANSPAFRRAERTYSIVWGSALLVECVVRLIGVYTLPVDTMVWLSTVLMLATILLTFRISYFVAIRPMRTLFLAELGIS